MKVGKERGEFSILWGMSSGVALKRSTTIGIDRTASTFSIDSDFDAGNIGLHFREVSALIGRASWSLHKLLIANDLSAKNSANSNPNSIENS